MPATFSTSTVLLLLLAQGAGSLFLALLLGTLYAYRRQRSYLCWSLAWLCNGLWLIGGTLSQQSDSEPWLQDAAVLFGWWLAAFWLLSLGYFRHAPEGERTAAPPALSLPFALALLLVVGILALVIGRLLPPRSRQVSLCVVLGLIFAWSTAVAYLHWRSVRRVPVLVLTVALALYALHTLLRGAFQFQAGDPDDPSQPYAGFTTLAGWAVEMVLAVAMILFVIDAEQAGLQQAVQRVEESEERFRLIFEHSGVGMSLLTRDGHFLQVNPALVRMLGYLPEELRGKRLADFVHARDASRDAMTPPGTPLEQDTPSFYEREKRYVRKDGDSIWAKVLRVPIRDAAGITRHYVGVLIDITLRKRAEEQLAASEQRYRLLNQVAHDGILVTDETGRFLEVNPAFREMLGHRDEALLQQGLLDVAADPHALREHLARVLAEGGDRIETQLRTRDGRLIDVELAGALLDFDGKRLLHGICRDVTEKKRNEERLQEERDFSRQVLETADVLIFVVDPAGRIVHFNNTCAAVLGYREEEVRGKLFWEVVLPERHAALVRDGYHQLLASPPGPRRGPDEAPLVYEMHWRTRAGDERLVSWRNAVVRDAQGLVRYVISTGLDVTQQRQLEEQVRQARKLESLGTLVGGIAHDFNNHLTAVLGNLAMALGDLETLHEGEAHFLHAPLSQAEKGAQRCAEITRHLLTFSSGKVVSTSRLTIGQVVHEAARQIQSTLPASIQLHVRVEENVWPVLGDAAQLQQVLLNLSANACEAMGQSGVLSLTTANRTLTERDCLLSAEARPGRFVEVTVSDTGGGMSAEVLGRLFEPFFTTKQPGRAAGLGLAVAYGIVKAHNGWISVQSEPGRGSTFRIYLPTTVSGVLPRPEAPLAVGSGSGCVLVVDDEDLVRGLAEAVLRRGGYEVLTACDGEEALATYAAHRDQVDLVLLDFSMPKMNGLEVMRELLRMDPRVYVIFTSGFTRDSDSDELLATGAQAFIPKPYHPDELLDLVRRVLERKRLPSTPGVRP